MSNLAQAQLAFERTLYLSAAFGFALGGAACTWRAPIGGGFLCGVAAGTVAYLWMARMLPRLGQVEQENLQLYTVRQALGRLGIYAVAIVLAYKLDPTGKLGVIAALAGILYVRGAATLAAWRMAKSSATTPSGDTP